MGWSWEQRQRYHFEGKKALHLDQVPGQLKGSQNNAMLDVFTLVRNPLVAKNKK